MTHCGPLWLRSVDRPGLLRSFPAGNEPSLIERGVSNRYALTPVFFTVIDSRLHFTVLRPSVFKTFRDHGPRFLRSAFCVVTSSEF